MLLGKLASCGALSLDVVPIEVGADGRVAGGATGRVLYNCFDFSSGVRVWGAGGTFSFELLKNDVGQRAPDDRWPLYGVEVLVRLAASRSVGGH